MEKEKCVECDRETGKAGAGEDSLYFGETGPLCDDCYDHFEDRFLPLDKETLGDMKYHKDLDDREDEAFKK